MRRPATPKHPPRIWPVSINRTVIPTLLSLHRCSYRTSLVFVRFVVIQPFVPRLPNPPERIRHKGRQCHAIHLVKDDDPQYCYGRLLLATPKVIPKFAIVYWHWVVPWEFHDPIVPADAMRMGSHPHDWWRPPQSNANMSDPHQN